MAEKRTRKVVLLGEGAVGKTSLIRKFVSGAFDEKYISTVGTTMSKKSLVFEDVNLDMIIWDIQGQHGLSSLMQNYMRGAQGAILVGDLTRAETFAKLSGYWGPELYKVAQNIPVVVVGNKLDLASGNFAPYVAEEGNKLTLQSYKVVGMYKTSAKTGNNVEDAFQALGKALIQV